MADETYPQELKYYREHDWVRLEGEDAVFGITACNAVMISCRWVSPSGSVWSRWSARTDQWSLFVLASMRYLLDLQRAS